MRTELLTIPDFCKSVNIGTTRCYELINNGTINAVKLGKKTLIKREELDRFIESLAPFPFKQNQGEG